MFQIVGFLSIVSRLQQLNELRRKTTKNHEVLNGQPMKLNQEPESFQREPEDTRFHPTTDQLPVPERDYDGGQPAPTAATAVGVMSRWYRNYPHWSAPYPMSGGWPSGRQYPVFSGAWPRDELYPSPWRHQPYGPPSYYNGNPHRF